MKKLIVILMLMLVVPLMATYRRHTAFLDGTLGVGTSSTATNGSEFESANIKIHDVPFIGVTAIFTRAAGSTSTVEFIFDVSFDGGATWATFIGTDVEIATNTAVISGTTVRCFYEISVYGLSNIRLRSVKNNDSSNAISAVNVVLSR